MTCFVLYLKKVKRYDIETLSVDRVLNTEPFLGKSCWKCAPEVIPGPLLTLGSNLKNHCMQETLLKMRYFERGLSKSLKKINLIFSFEPSPF